MIDAINTAVSGLNGFNKGLQVISENVTNMNTPGYKGSNVQFEDQLASPFGGQAGSNGGGVPEATGGATPKAGRAGWSIS